MNSSNASKTKNILLIKVDDTFQVTGYGLILSPWLLLSKWEHKFKSTRTEVKLLIKKPEEVKMITSGLILYPFLTPTPKERTLIICLPSASKVDILLDSEVWLIDKTG